MSETFVEEGTLNRIREIIAAVDYHLSTLKALSRAIGKPLPKEKIENEYFVAEVKYIPLGDRYLNAIFKVIPKIEVNPDLMKLLYVSEIFLKDEISILKTISSGTWERLARGNNISFSIVMKEDVKQLITKSILAKIARAFRAFMNDHIRKKLLQEKKRLESLAKNPREKAKDIILTIMKINELLFYES